MYTDVHTCTHMYVHTCTHMYVHTRTHMYTYVHTCTHMYTYVHICTQMYTDVHTCTHMYTDVHRCTHMYTHVAQFISNFTSFSLLNITHYIYSKTISVVKLLMYKLLSETGHTRTHAYIIIAMGYRIMPFINDTITIP